MFADTFKTRYEIAGDFGILKFQSEVEMAFILDTVHESLCV